MEDTIVTQKIKWHPKIHKLSQVPSEGLEYALVSADFEQVHQLVWCKDFIQDAVFAGVTRTAVNIYGFEYDPNVEPMPCLNKMKILITNYKDREFKERLFTRSLPLLNSVESRLRIRKTTVKKCSGTPPVYGKSGVWLLEGSKRWLIAPPMVSFYTFLIRLGMVAVPGDSLETTLNKITMGEIHAYYDDGKEDEVRDKEVAVQARSGMERILRLKDKVIFGENMAANYGIKDGEERFMDVDTIHESCGLVSFSTQDCHYEFPHWYKEENYGK